MPCLRAIGEIRPDVKRFRVQEIKLTDIDPNPKQPRKQFDEERLKN